MSSAEDSAMLLNEALDFHKICYRPFRRPPHRSCRYASFRSLACHDSLLCLTFTVRPHLAPLGRSWE